MFHAGPSNIDCPCLDPHIPRGAGRQGWECKLKSLKLASRGIEVTGRSPGAENRPP